MTDSLKIPDIPKLDERGALYILEGARTAGFAEGYRKGHADGYGDGASALSRAWFLWVLLFTVIITAVSTASLFNVAQYVDEHVNIIVSDDQTLHTRETN